MSRPLSEQRAEFVVDDAVAYFNTAGLSPMLRTVREAAERALDRRSMPWTITAQEWFADVEELRASVARLMGVAADDVALVPSSSYGLATVARNLSTKPGDRVLVLADEFPSNHYTWQRFTRRTGAELVVVARDPGQRWVDAILGVIDERVAIASLPNVHWTNGALIDLERVARALHDAGAVFIVDASQSLGALPLDVAALLPDAVVAVGYKWLLGPFSLGYLYLHPKFHDGEPLEENWIARVGAEDFSRLIDYQEAYQPGARRFDVGERSNFQLLPAASAAIRRLLDWTVAAVAATLRARTDEIAARVRQAGVPVAADDARGPHILGLELPAPSILRVTRALRDARVVTSLRGSSLRISPHLHNDARDVDRLLEVLRAAL